MAEDHRCFLAWARTATPKQVRDLEKYLKASELGYEPSILEGVALLECMAKFWIGFKKLPEAIQEQAIDYAIIRAEQRELANET